jgi:hypothetical protein
VDIAEAEKVGRLLVRFDDRTADLDQPVRVTRGGTELFAGPVRRTIGTLARTLADAGDPRLMFPAEVAVELK